MNSPAKNVTDTKRFDEETSSSSASAKNKNKNKNKNKSKTYKNPQINSSATSGGTGSVNLSSPESAYSTGYSTDGTSPGASFPPEYYINIRTGTHYFEDNKSGGAGSQTPSGTVNKRLLQPGEAGHEPVTPIIPKNNKTLKMTKDRKRDRVIRTNTSVEVSSYKDF